jgi:hypothetical protein
MGRTSEGTSAALAVRMKLAICCLALAACVVGEAEDEFDNSSEDGEGAAAFAGPPPTIAQCGASATQAVLSPSATLTTKVEVSGHAAWATFTEPATGDTGHIIKGLIRLIAGVPAGGTINGAIHSLGLADVALALGCAHARGVTVNIVIDGQVREGGQLSTLGAFLEQHATKFVVCNSAGGDGCNTTNSSAIMHSKIFTFSSTFDPEGTRRSHVSWFGSANLTAKTGMNTANNTLTTFENPALQHSLDDYIDLMASKHPVAGRKLDVGDGVDANGVASPSSDPDNDIVRNRLDKIDPSASPCTIDVAEGLISGRPRVFDKLASLANKGCRVRVLGNDGSRKADNGETIYNSRRDALRTMKSGGAKIRLGRVHDKLLLIDARYDGERRRLVFTGSHNLTASANKINDELFLGIRGPSVLDAYTAHFDRVWAQSDPY